MGKKFTLTFGKSTSQNYQYAVDLATKYDTYQQSGDEKNILHSITFTEDQIKDFFALYDLVGRWKSTNVSIDGELVPPTSLAFLWCYKNRLRAYDPNEYCLGKDDARSYNDNDFGCRHAGINVFGWDGLSGYGEMDKQGNFHVNKDKLTHDIMKNLDEYKWCPALNLTKVKQEIEKIPDQINPKTNRSWEYVIDYQNGKEIAVSVRKKQKQSGFMIKDNEDHIYKIEVAASNTARGSGCLVSLLSMLSLFILLLLPLILF